MKARKRAVLQVVLTGTLYVALGIGRLGDGGMYVLTPNQRLHLFVVMALGVGLILGALVGLIKNKGEE